jgi:hypothetical protein
MYGAAMWKSLALFVSLLGGSIAAQAISFGSPTLGELYAETTDVLLVEEVGPAAPEQSLDRAEFRVIEIWKSSDAKIRPGNAVLICHAFDGLPGYKFGQAKPGARSFVFLRSIKPCLYQYAGYASVLGVINDEPGMVRTDALRDGPPRRSVEALRASLNTLKLKSTKNRAKSTSKPTVGSGRSPANP